MAIASCLVDTNILLRMTRRSDSQHQLVDTALAGLAFQGTILSRLSWKWRKRSSVEIAERTYEERAQALHC